MSDLAHGALSQEVKKSEISPRTAAEIRHEGNEGKDAFYQEAGGLHSRFVKQREKEQGSVNREGKEKTPGRERKTKEKSNTEDETNDKER